MKNYYKALLISLFATILATSQAAAITTSFTFVNGLLGANEVGPNASAGSGTINTLEYDSDVGTFGTFTVNVDYTGLTGNASAAHIHGPAAVGSNGSVFQGLSETGGTAGNISGTWTLLSSADRDNLFNDLAYINLHSESFGGGELRGQLTPVPEPSTTAALCGLLALGFALTRRNRNS